MTPDWLQPMPWLQMQQQSSNPTVGEGIMSAVGSLGPALMGRSQSGGSNPPARKYRTYADQQRARMAGDYANSIMGAPPPMY
jgi:hypothetical protein